MASPQPRIGVITYPGSQDDRDALWALAALDAEAVAVWHEEERLPDLDAVVLPGGFSYGDYLRCGAIARFSQIMRAVETVLTERKVLTRDLGGTAGTAALTEALVAALS